MKKHRADSHMTHECRVGVLRGRERSQSPGPHVIVVRTSEVLRTWVKKRCGGLHTFPAATERANKSAISPVPEPMRGVRGQIKKVSWHGTSLPSEVYPANGIKSLARAASDHHSEPLPSLVSTRNWRANFETDARPCLDALMRFSFIWIMKELSTILVSLFFPISLFPRCC